MFKVASKPEMCEPTKLYFAHKHSVGCTKYNIIVASRYDIKLYLTSHNTSVICKVFVKIDLNLKAN